MGCAISVVELEANNVISNIVNPVDCSPRSQPEGLASLCEGGNITFSCPAQSTLLNDDVPVPGGELTVACPDFVDEFDFTLPTPAAACQANSGISGDPHVRKWNGEFYDWHAECDAVFLHAPDFRDGLGMDIHTRTSVRYWYSYIETAAVRIGSDIFEVSSWGDSMLNGVSSPEMPQTIGGCCEITHTQVNAKKHIFSINLGDHSTLEVSTHKDIVSVNIIHQTSPTAEKWFGSSSGLMGSYYDGNTLARDGVTALEDPNELGQEWQVIDSDPMLFQNQDRAPQFPSKCRLPDKGAKSQTRRQLGQGISRDAASKACAHLNKEEVDNCIYDVMATGDLDLADGYF